MQGQKGNFLLQALLALALIFAFLPFFAQQLAGRDIDAQMYSSTRKVEVAQTAARIFIREQANNLPYETTVVSGNAFADLLEPYGLPLGFVARTAFGQDIALVISKSGTEVNAFLRLSGGNLSGLQLAELARRIGFYATTNGNNEIIVGLALDEFYSDVVKRNETNLDNGAFLTDLDMGGFSLNNAGSVFARRGEFETGQFNTLTMFGIENGRKARNSIDFMGTEKAIFQSPSGGAALSLTRGSLYAETVNAKTISNFGDAGNFTANSAAVYEFAMSAGRTGFYGPTSWYVGGDVITDNINFSVERLELNSFLNASRGQDVYLYTDTFSYSVRSGIETGTILASNITLRDQTSSALNEGESGSVILDIRPAGTSLLPDALVDSINNGAFKILDKPTSDSSKTVDCRSIITKLGGQYNQKSLSQYIICQYVFWQRLEKRIDAKQCLLEGNSGCI